MTRLTAQSVTPAVRSWLRHARDARILHVFERAVNLIAGDEVLSLVTPEIGDGPFNVVLPSCNFAQHITASDPLRITPNGLHIGDLVIDLSSAALWHPYPDSHQLCVKGARMRAQAPVIRAVLQQYAPANSLARMVVDLPTPPSNLESRLVDAARQHWQDLYQGALNLDHAVCVASAKQLVGLGSGLTPAGDDWLLGCALAAHLGLPSPTAAVLILDAVGLAAPSTNPLSSCWLRAAVNGACSRRWHTFFARCLGADSRAVYQAALHIVRQGHSSGADALAGYFALLVSV
jgi:hypothetical protein